MKEIITKLYKYECEKCGQVYKNKELCENGEGIPIRVSKDIHVGDKILILNSKCSGREGYVEEITVNGCSNDIEPSLRHKELLYVDIINGLHTFCSYGQYNILEKNT